MAALVILERLLYTESLKGYNSYKQQLTLILLNNRVLSAIGSLEDADSSCFNSDALKKIADILDNKYNKEDIILKQLTRCYSPYIDSVEYKSSYAYIKRKAAKLNMTVREWEDSVNNACLKEAMQVDTSKIYFDNGVLAIIGNLKFKEFAPKLERLLHDKRYREYHADILLVLARLEYKDYEKRYLDKLLSKEYKCPEDLNIIIKKLRQIGTQNALFELSKFIDVPFEIVCRNPYHKKRVLPYGYSILFKLCKYIENYPYDICRRKAEYTKDGALIIHLDAAEYECSCEHLPKYPKNILELSKEWMKKNKGKYKISSSFKTSL